MSLVDEIAGEACSVGCPGWFVNRERLTIEKCDSCAKFETDDDAAEVVIKLEQQESRVLEKYALIGLARYLMRAIENQCVCSSPEVREHNAVLYIKEAKEVLDAII